MHSNNTNTLNLFQPQNLHHNHKLHHKPFNSYLCIYADFMQPFHFVISSSHYYSNQYKKIHKKESGSCKFPSFAKTHPTNNTLINYDREFYMWVLTCPPHIELIETTSFWISFFTETTSDR